MVKPDGTVISAEPTQVQMSDVPAQRGNPVYADTKVMRVSLSGIEPGTIVDYSTTTEELKPFLAMLDASVAAQLGDADRALRVLRQRLAEFGLPTPSTWHGLVWPLEPLAALPEFRALVGRFDDDPDVFPEAPRPRGLLRFTASRQ